MNAAELFVKCLENENVRYIFGVPGEENEDFLFALENSSIEFIPTRHEQGAAFIANVYGRLTGNAGVCLSTLGPGATNLITGVADAYLDKSPLVAITAQGSMDRMHHESHQMIDVNNLMKPITKWNSSMIDPEVIPELVRKAFKLAQQEKPGACHLELPEDVAARTISKEPEMLRNFRTRRPDPNPESLTMAIKLLEEAKKPVILAGNGAIRNRSSEALCALSSKFNIPVASTFMGKGAVSDRSEQSLGAIGLGFRDYVVEAFAEADLVLCIGYDIAEYDPVHWNTGHPKKIIHFDFDPSEVYRDYIPVVEVIGDLANAIEYLTGKLNCEVKSNWFSSIRKRIFNSIDSYSLPDAAGHFNVPAVIAATREVLDDVGLLISDVGSHKMWIARNFKTYIPNGCIISNGLASMGISLPGGIAAKLDKPNRHVVSMMGDGGALMNIQELETARRLGLGYTIIVLNDNNYGLIEWKQQRNKRKSFGTKLGNPDFAELAKSFDIVGHKPSTIGEFKTTLRDMLDSNTMNLIEIPINTEVNDALTKELSEYFKNT